MKVAVMGKLRSGKTTASNYLALQLGCETFDFSDALKEVVGIMYPKSKEHKDRSLLQKVGQHMREIDEDVWVNALMDRVKNSGYRNSVVTGLRQPNEHKALVDDGYFIIKIDAPTDVRVNRAIKSGDKMDESNLTHETESYIDDLKADIVITNDGNKYDLFRKLDKAISDLLFMELNRNLLGNNR